MKVSVRSGDSLWYYSQLFGIPFSLVVDSNRSINPNQLSIGQQVQIPGYVLTNYSIKLGDTLWAISRRQGYPLDVLYLLNKATNPNALQIGQTILVPVRVTWRVVNGKEAYSYLTMINDINQLVSIYPFIRQKSIGTSVMGKSIPELRIGRGSKQVHINASFHANEWITTPIMMKFLNEYLLALTNQTPIRGIPLNPFYNQTDLSAVPMVNPDGVNLVLQGLPEEEPFRSQVSTINNNSMNFDRWKANIHGVDLNNQYPAKWELESERKQQSPSPFNYPGPYPLSEPEAQAVAELTRSRDFTRALAFHTQGEVIYWGYESLEPPSAEVIVEEFERVSGYRPIRFIDSYAGYKDWYIQEWRRPGYTVELGKGTSPLPLTQFDEIYEETLGIFLANLYL
ncbi:LysM peptidoglycan-binding domain-containing protein [Pontibacillus yanchengensis]|uniref:LysM peptidoglycan-binding domain-containing protein n=2 Tax=Pontibacillus yanchengensis TaxID=462910 RepID=A0A6I4ZVM7_9BACI|nr:M14 family metallopeptidase [Pontibacillus yanchengensis]MYL32030.1 LysM peptidoglycan-binding domain-containing protein [Pontibacillus yanchengensis]MYL52608.1 LysM peptidoglycan-binding domain-containing protein [Pontibacillus yanchengensis]